MWLTSLKKNWRKGRTHQMPPLTIIRVKITQPKSPDQSGLRKFFRAWTVGTAGSRSTGVKPSPRAAQRVGIRVATSTTQIAR